MQEFFVRVESVHLLFWRGTGERTVSESRKWKILMIKLIRKVSDMDPEN